MADRTTSTTETSKAETPKIETLQQIWQRIFRQPIIGPNEDFFELGGDAWLAAELFTEINTRFSFDFPPTVICNAPTVAALASTVDGPQPQGPAIPLKSGKTHASPIFMFHGIGSSVIDLVPLVRCLQVDQAIFALESRGNDGREQPEERIEDIAQSFLAAIHKIQPHGPYFLIGYSFGGLVALEVAQRLKAKSEQIGLLVMLDSYPDRHYLSYPQYWRLLLQLAMNRVTGRNNPAATRRPLPSQGQPNSLVHALRRTKDAHYRALRNYRPRFYDGDVKFIRAAIPTHFPADPVRFWSPLIRSLSLENVPGEHVTLLTASASPIASLLDKYLLNHAS